MTLKNSFHTQLAIGILLNDEETLDAKLNLLTEISLTATNPETFEICEGFRDRICDSEQDPNRGGSSVHHRGFDRKEGSGSGSPESNEMDGAE